MTLFQDHKLKGGETEAQTQTRDSSGFFRTFFAPLKLENKVAKKVHNKLKISGNEMYLKAGLCVLKWVLAYECRAEAS